MDMESLGIKDLMRRVIASSLTSVKFAERYLLVQDVHAAVLL